MSDDVRRFGGATCCYNTCEANRLGAFIKQEPSPGPHHRKRRWQIPPLPNAVLRGFPGSTILEEINLPPLALLLWQRFNDVQEWIRTPDPQKHGLLGFPAEYEAVLTRAAENAGEAAGKPLRAIRPLLEKTSAYAQDMARLCEQIGAWASREGFVETAAMYYLLAAHALPKDQAYNYAAGRAERICARYHRAEQWFLRAIGLSRRAGDDETYATAYLGWGVLEEQRGDHAAAQLRYIRALRAAKRGQLRPLAAAAHHNMIPLAAQAADFDLAGRALEEAGARGEQATSTAALGILGAVQSATPGDRNIAPPERLQRFATRLIKRVKEFPVCNET